jgi:choline dehydrogenase-like flavoprotein
METWRQGAFDAIVIGSGPGGATVACELSRHGIRTLIPHGRTLPSMVKIKDDLGGHLTARGGVRKRLTEHDRTRLIRGSAAARRILKNVGA